MTKQLKKKMIIAAAAFLLGTLASAACLGRKISKIDINFEDTFDGGWFHDWASVEKRED